MLCQWRAVSTQGLGVSLLLLALFGACGGQAGHGTQFIDGTAGTALSNAGSSAEGNRGGTATAGGGGSSAGQGISGSFSTGGSGRGLPCVEPVAPTDAASCDFGAYAFDAEAERCRYFVKASCGVTRNRFVTLEACVATCDPGGIEHCRIAADCRVRTAGCCGGCEPVKRDDLRAISSAYADVETCPGVLCGPCATYDGPPERPYYGATCTNQLCELIDVRDTEVGSCEGDGDCRLRLGLQCCECGSAGPWVAVSNDSVAASNLLCGAPLNCDQTCDRTPPKELRASCSEGRCLVSRAEP